MKKFYLVAGIELEVEYNRKKMGLVPRGSYHHSTKRFGKYFTAEDDGSLRATKFKQGEVAEFVSKPFDARKYKEVLKDFKEAVYDKVAEYKNLSKEKANQNNNFVNTICFNETTGAHIHLSLVSENNRSFTIQDSERNITEEFKGQQMPIARMLNTKMINKITNNIFEQVEKEFPTVASKWKEKYYRHYAKKMKSINTHDRYSSWNFTLGDRRVEFRSFHLTGIKSWAEFNKMYNIVFSTINNAFKEEFKKEEPFKEQIKINVRE